MPRTNLGLSISGSSDVGMVREGNEDSFIALSDDNAPGLSNALLIVADGMGGHLAGEVASAMAVESVVNDLKHNLVKGEVEVESVFKAAVQLANGAINEGAKKPETSGMATTFTGALLIGHFAVFAHVGDSRAYLCRDGRTAQITKDHSWVAEQVEMGTMTEEEAEQHPQRNVITRAVGINPEVDVDTGQLELMPEDILVFCSDGLTSYVDAKEINEVCTNFTPSEACTDLIEKAKARGGHDNITVIVANITEIKLGNLSDIQERLTNQFRNLRDLTPKIPLADRVKKLFGRN